MTQHTASLEIAARIDLFRHQFPNDHARLLAEYADLHPSTYRDEEIEEKDEEIKALTDTIESMKEELEDDDA